MKAFIEWKKLARGTYTTSAINGAICSAWKVGGGARWTVEEAKNGAFLGGGKASDLDTACDMAISLAESGDSLSRALIETARMYHNSNLEDHQWLGFDKCSNSVCLKNKELSK